MASIITSIRINDTDQSASLLSRIRDVVYSEESTNTASTLDVNFVLGTGLVLPVDPEIYQKLGLTISYLGNNLVLNNFYIDRNVVKVKNNIEFVGSQAYNYGLGLSQTGSGTDSNNTQVNIGGVTGTPSGRQTLDSIISLLCSPFNLNRSSSIGTHWAGFSNSRFIAVGILEPNYLAAFQKMALVYGYALNFISSTNPSFNGFCFFEKFKTIESTTPVVTIDRSDIHKEFSYQIDLTKSARNFVVLYKNTDPYVLEATDYRISSVNQKTIDVRSENLQEDLTAALARLEGLINEYNQKNITATFSVVGNPLIRVNKTITLTGFNTNINGNYVVTKVRHSVSSSGYISDIECYKVLNWTLTTPGGGGDVRYTTISYEDWS